MSALDGGRRRRILRAMRKLATVLALGVTLIAACGGDDAGTSSAPDASAAIDASGVDAAMDAKGAADASAPDETGAVDGASDVAVDAWDGAVPAVNPACVKKALAGVPDAELAIPSSSGTSGSLKYTTCPNGSNAGVSPKICIEEASLGKATLAMTATATDVKLSGTMPLRVQDVPVVVNLTICSPTISTSTSGDASCPGGLVDQVPVSIEVAIHPAEASSLSILMVADTNAVLANFSNDTSICNVPACDATCCATNQCSCALAGVTNWSAVKASVESSMLTVMTSSMGAQIEAALCATSGGGACPAGTTADAKGICRYKDQTCAPSPALFASGC